jgi:hypothetical protein
VRMSASALDRQTVNLLMCRPVASDTGMDVHESAMGRLVRGKHGGLPPSHRQWEGHQLSRNMMHST